MKKRDKKLLAQRQNSCKLIHRVRKKLHKLVDREMHIVSSEVLRALEMADDALDLALKMIEKGYNDEKKASKFPKVGSKKYKAHIAANY